MQTKEAQLLEGKTLAVKIQEEIKTKVKQFLAQGLGRPRLVALEASDDGGSKWYIGQQEKLAAKLDIAYERIPVSGQKQLEEKIQNFNGDRGCHGRSSAVLTILIVSTKAVPETVVLGSSRTATRAAVMAKSAPRATASGR